MLYVFNSCPGCALGQSALIYRHIGDILLPVSIPPFWPFYFKKKKSKHANLYSAYPA
jgi:hypothetical protein